MQTTTYHTMTEPHHATPEQWADVEKRASDCRGGPACLLELRDRLAAAEQRISELERLQNWVPPELEDSLDAFDQRISELEANSKPTAIPDVEYTMLLRGGSWNNHPRVCRSAYRNRRRPDDAGCNVGFRVVCIPRNGHTIRLEGPADD